MRKITVENYAGDNGAELLRWFTSFADPGLLSSWKGIGGGGNCFHSTMCASASIIKYSEGLRTKDQRRLLNTTHLVTGRFVIPESDGGGVVDHAWIERDIDGNIIVLNVSNLGDGKPLYVMSKAEYLKLNECDHIHQSISLRAIYRPAASAPS